MKGFGDTAIPPEANHAEPGGPAEHEWGVQYQGPYEALDDGAARAVRLHARALAARGVPVLLQSFSNTFRGPDGVVVGAEAMSPSVKKETHELRHASVRELRLRVKHLIVHSPEQLRASIIPNSVAIDRDTERAMAIREHLYRTTIVYSVWERTTISDNIAAILRRVGENWVPCGLNAELLRAHGVERVTVVPHPWEASSDLAKLSVRQASGRRKFYAIGLWQPRKGFHELLGAFLRAFKPSDDVHLTIKHRATQFPGYPDPESSVRLWLEDGRVRRNGWAGDRLENHLWLPGGHFSESQMLRLHYDSNIYVSSSRGEAYNLGAFDAKVAGNRMVHVAWGGTTEFAGEHDGIVPYELSPVPDTYQWEPGARWADFDVDELAIALANQSPPQTHARGPQMDRLEFQEIGKLMAARVRARMEAR